MSERTLLLLSALVVTACGAADAPETGAEDSVAVARIGPPTVGADTIAEVKPLRCADGRIVSATYFVGPGRRVNLQLGDTAVQVPAAASASGARYATTDESIVWWNTGDTSSLTWQGRTTSCVVDSTVQF